MTTIEALELRHCLGRFATGVTVVTYDLDGQPRGATVNAFSAVSLDPPLVLVSVARKARACEALVERPFCVNVLAASQMNEALTFAGVERPGCSIAWNVEGLAPRLGTSHAWIQCAPWRSYDGGDHVLFLGQVEQFQVRDVEPLLFYAGKFHRRGDGLDELGYPRSAHCVDAAPLSIEAMEFASQEAPNGWL